MQSKYHIFWTFLMITEVCWNHPVSFSSTVKVKDKTHTTVNSILIGCIGTHTFTYVELNILTSLIPFQIRLNNATRQKLSMIQLASPQWKFLCFAWFWKAGTYVRTLRKEWSLPSRDCVSAMWIKRQTMRVYCSILKDRKVSRCDNFFKLSHAS